MRRREVLALIGAAAFARPATAQPPKTPMIGVLFGGSAALFTTAGLQPFLEGLGGSGYRDGENITLVVRVAEGRYERLPSLAGELLGLQAAVIATFASAATLATKAATGTTPVVFTMAADPVALGIVASLSRPGGNITGATFLSIELLAKQLELLHALLPTPKSSAF